MDNLTVSQGMMIGYHALGQIINLADSEESSTGDIVLAGFASAAQVLLAEVIDAINNNAAAFAAEETN